MNFVGIDLHKKTISLCVMNQTREILSRRRFYCAETGRIADFFEGVRPFPACAQADGKAKNRGATRVLRSADSGGRGPRTRSTSVALHRASWPSAL